MFKSRKNGVFAVGENMVASIQSSGNDKKNDSLTIGNAL